MITTPRTFALPRYVRVGFWSLLAVAALAVLIAIIWQGVTSAGAPDPTAPHLDRTAVILNTGILVFREGLEAILVLAAIVASFVGANSGYRRPVIVGAALGFVASIITWFIAVAIIDSMNAPALDIQAATGLLAIVVLLVIMNWFFHNVYWTGWISHHNRRRKSLMDRVRQGDKGTFWGFALLGFSAMYREGFEVVLFLQSLRLRSGTATVLQGVLIGLAFTATVGVITFLLNRKLPYKKMLVLTGVMLGAVLVVMVGESAQELQLANWISTTPVPLPIPAWMGTWFAVFPNVESLAAQAFAAAFVIGSYFMAREIRVWRPIRRGQQAAQRASAPPEA